MVVRKEKETLEEARKLRNRTIVVKKKLVTEEENQEEEKEMQRQKEKMIKVGYNIKSVEPVYDWEEHVEKLRKQGKKLYYMAGLIPNAKIYTKSLNRYQVIEQKSEESHPEDKEVK